MFNLIRNELFKTMKKRKLYVFMIMILGICLLFGLTTVFLQNNPDIEADSPQISGQQFPLSLLDGLGSMMAIFLVLLVADFFTDEYSSGTLKLPLIRPISRNQLFTAKVLSLFIITTFLYLYAAGTAYIVGTIFVGWGAPLVLGSQALSASMGILTTLGAYVISVFPIVAFIMIAVYFSLRFSNTGSVIGISLGIFFGMNIVSQLSETIRPFILSTYLSLYGLFFSGQTQEALQGVAAVVIYSGVFLFFSYSCFNKKDILE